MHFNVLVVPTLMLSIGLFWLGSTFERKARTAVTRSGIVVAGILLAIPGCLFVFYYVHLFDNSAWFYVFRAAPFTELTAAGLGFIAGFIHSTMAAEGFGEKLIVPGILAFLVVIPFAKPLLSPLEYGALKDRWDGEVCLQSTFSTCGPASAATILKGLGHQASERELAEECFTYRGGTENWYLARALRRRGFDTRVLVQSPASFSLPSPALAGVVLPGRAGHFIAILGQTPTHVILADPMKGKLILDRTELQKYYHFSGFFLVVYPARTNISD